MYVLCNAKLKHLPAVLIFLLRRRISVAGAQGIAQRGVEVAKRYGWIESMYVYVDLPTTKTSPDQTGPTQGESGAFPGDD